MRHRRPGRCSLTSHSHRTAHNAREGGVSFRVHPSTERCLIACPSTRRRRRCTHVPARVMSARTQEVTRAAKLHLPSTAPPTRRPACALPPSSTPSPPFLLPRATAAAVRSSSAAHASWKRADPPARAPDARLLLAASAWHSSSPSLSPHFSSHSAPPPTSPLPSALLPNPPLSPIPLSLPTMRSSLFLFALVLLLSLSFSLSQPSMPSPPGSDDSALLSYSAFDLDAADDFDVMQVGGLGYGLGYGGGGKGAFPVGAFGANVGLPAVPAVPLAIAYGGGGKGKHGGGGGHGHGKGREGGVRLGFLIAAPVPVAQPYGGPLSRRTHNRMAGPLCPRCSPPCPALLCACLLLSPCAGAGDEEGSSRSGLRLRLRSQRRILTNTTSTTHTANHHHPPSPLTSLLTTPLTHRRRHRLSHTQIPSHTRTRYPSSVVLRRDLLSCLCCSHMPCFASLDGTGGMNRPRGRELDTEELHASLHPMYMS